VGGDRWPESHSVIGGRWRATVDHHYSSDRQTHNHLTDHRITDCWSPTTDHIPQTTDHISQTAGHRTPITGEL